MKDRFGVVNGKERDRYEKYWQIPFGYEFITFDRDKAIDYCQKTKNPDMIVEQIHTGDLIDRRGLLIKEVHNQKERIYP